MLALISRREDTMSQLIVRKLEPSVVAALRARAARHGLSVEAEHREILRSVLRGPGPSHSLKELLRSMPDVGTDADFARVRQRPRRVRL